MLTDDYVYEDRRHHGQSFPNLDAESTPRAVTSLWDTGAGEPRFTMHEILAVRGDRIAACRVSVDYPNGWTTESIEVMELDAGLSLLRRWFELIAIEVNVALQLPQGFIKANDDDGLAQEPVAVVGLDHHCGEPLAPHCDNLLVLPSWLPRTGFPERPDELRNGLGINVGKVRSAATIRIDGVVRHCCPHQLLGRSPVLGEEREDVAHVFARSVRRFVAHRPDPTTAVPGPRRWRCCLRLRCRSARLAPPCVARRGARKRIRTSTPPRGPAGLSRLRLPFRHPGAGSEDTARRPARRSGRSPPG